jgi:hypothetical protein
MEGVLCITRFLFKQLIYYSVTFDGVYANCDDGRFTINAKSAVAFFKDFL